MILVGMRLTLPAAIAIVLLTAGCSGSDDPVGTAGDSTTTLPPATTATPTPTPEPTQDTTAPASTLIDYGDDGIVVSAAGDEKRLEGAPADFTTFIVAELARQQATKDDVCTEKPEIRVERVDVRGWAAGGVSIPQCGGNAALWARTGGAWKTVWSDQTLPDCSVLEKYDFPPSIAGAECGTADGKTRRYP